MHELSIAMSLLDTAAEEADRHGGDEVLALHLRIGPLSGVVSAALISAFELARESSPMPRCRLVIEEVPILIDCEVCQSQQPVRGIQDICCAVCGTPTMNIITGRELDVIAMELRNEQANAVG